ncbi:MAG: Ig-like domain-containing protein [Lachnospiraceae bacterium]|nr:Ig-like domain-containing protein [Lachnospiraceae bacterium]
MKKGFNRISSVWSLRLFALSVLEICLVAALCTFQPQVKARAAGQYGFQVGNDVVQDGGTINYSKYTVGFEPLTIILVPTDGGGIAPGTKFEWIPTNENIIKVRPTTDKTVTLDIISPGYSGLTVFMIAADGTEYKVGNCEIYVPLEWSDNETDPVMNNILGTSSNGYYGLIHAQQGDSAATEDNPKGIYTLQLFTSDSGDRPANQPDGSHYLRKLNYVSYTYADGRLDPATGQPYKSVSSDLKQEELGAFTSALDWSSSNSEVAEVDSLTGFITAKSAGFTTITVKTRTFNELLNESDELSFDVVVVPEANVPGGNTVSISSDKLFDWTGSSITFQTNAKHADSLEWRVFQGDYPSTTNEITGSIKDDIVPSDSTGKCDINNLKAGVYCITAVPKKTSEAVTKTPTYDAVTAKSEFQYLKYVLVIPCKFPPADVTLSYYTTDLYDSYDLLANSNLPEGLFKFTLSYNENAASVGQANGVVDAVGEGKATVSITLKDVNEFKKRFAGYDTDPSKTGFDYVNTQQKTVNITVYDGIAINTTEATMSLGSTMKLALTAPNPYQGNILFESSDTNVVEVDDSGVVTAKKVGDATVTVTINVGSGVTKRAKCSIKVVSSVSEIKLTAPSEYVRVGDQLTITANITPQVTGASLLWSTQNPQVASKDTENPLSLTINGVSAGTTVITAVNPDNGVVGTMMVRVTSSITGITLSDATVSLPKSSGKYKLTAICTPELPPNEKLTWYTDDNKVVTVDQEGNVTVVNAGEATVTVITENGKLATCKFTILQDMESIVLDTEKHSMYVGQSYKLTYTINPNNTSDKSLDWKSSDSNIVSVDNTGYLTAKNTGTCTITAQAKDGSGKYATCTVTVFRNATDIVVDVNPLTLNVDETYQLNVQLNPTDSTDTVHFESNNTAIATVSATGKVTGVSKGSCIILIKTDAGKSTLCNVFVEQQVTGLELDKESAPLMVGETLQLIATVTPSNASDKELEWSSTNPDVATVDEDGKVTGIAGGYTIIKCTSLDGDFEKSCLVTVTEKVTTITLDNSSVEIGVGKKLTLNATISGETATNKEVKWTSSNKKVCKVTKNGVIKGVKAGKCTIKVKAKDGSGVYAKCTVRVIKATEDVELNKTYVDIIQGRTAKLKATTTPSKVTYNVVWSSSDDKVAIVSKKGKITAIKPGDCEIVCRAGDNSEIYAVCYVHVTSPVSISSFNFSESEMVMFAGETIPIQYSVTPINYTEGFSWSSDNPMVASVDSKGKVVAKAVGTAKITALSDSGKKSSFNVYVVGISKTKITLHQYESTKIALQIDGAAKGVIDVRWDTDNQSIAEISNGKVTGKALGTTTVYAIVNGRYLACTVKVIKN